MGTSSSFPFSHNFLSAQLDPKMEVERSEFEEKLPYLLKGIEECDFVAVDFEFTGLGIDPKRGRVEQNRKPTLAERYQENKEGAERWCIMQVGICIAKWDPVAVMYRVDSFNFHVAPYVLPKLRYNRAFSFTSDGIQFHVKHGFDFNRMFGRGCLYLSHEEEAHVRELKRQREENEFREIDVDPAEAPMLEIMKTRIAAWNKKRDGNLNDFLNLEPLSGDSGFNSYQRRILKQLLRKEFPGLIGISYDKHFQVVPLNEEREKMIVQKRDDDFEKIINTQRGIRLLFDKIMELKKPFVGHNLFTDLCYMHHMLIGKLPEDIEGFRQFLQQKFGLISDTKFLALNYDHSNAGAVSSSLYELANKYATQPFPKVVDKQTGEQDRIPLDHVAGYDAWCTARAFAKLSTHMLIAGSDNPPMPIEKSTSLDQRKKEIKEALATRPPRAGVGRMVELEPTPALLKIPRWSSNFWKVFGGRLCANGTIEGEFTF